MDQNQETQVNTAFTRKSQVYEAYGQKNKIVSWSRQRVYEHLTRYLAQGKQILELNGGTGEDGLYLSRQGHRVHIIELADGMIEKIKEKIKSKQALGRISYEQKSYLNLQDINQGPYDYIFSNFGGLNLTPDLAKVFQQFPNLLKENGFCTLVMLNQLSIWELSTVFWNRKTAFRRIPSIFGNPVPSNVSGQKVLTYYFSPKQVSKALGSSFKLIELQGLCSIVPPSYFEDFPIKHSIVFERLKRLEARMSHLNPISKIGDFFIATYQYKP